MKKSRDVPSFVLLVCVLGMRFPAILIVLVCALALSTHADTITVINTNDSGPGSLRQALAIANDGDTIDFDTSLNGQVITLTSGELVIGQNIAIIGPGPNLLTVSRAQNAANFRVFHVTSGHTVTIEGLTISNGNAQGNFPGAAGDGICSELSALSVNNCVITSNTALWGGGICNYGNASGAMIYLSNSSISSNLGLNAAGGIYNYSQGAFSSASLTVSNSTVNGNSSVEAGGIYNKTANGSDTLAINNSTISGNSANLTGGIENYAIGTNATATLTIANSTLSSNSALFKGGSAITNGGGTNGRDSPSTQSQATLGNTILNSDGSSPNILNSPGGIITSNGYNISNDNGSGYLTGPGDQINTDPILGPLQGNGGPTFTHALLPGSPAIDAGDPKFTPPPYYDQRGPNFSRVRDNRIDVGSFEVQQGTTPSPTPTPTLTPTPTPTATATSTPTTTPIPTSTPTPTPTARPTPSPRSSPSPRSRPTPPPRPALFAR
jgi:hypothetical protein